jgi:hypothetical protein
MDKRHRKLRPWMIHREEYGGDQLRRYPLQKILASIFGFQRVDVDSQSVL